ncbi:hypothetical protein HY404_01965 [Candidatus Microgenomates bacterium]|nr:hypothetical protein [Candidatus Microgenomates bacterium]
MKKEQGSNFNGEERASQLEQYLWIPYISNEDRQALTKFTDEVIEGRATRDKFNQLADLWVRERPHHMDISVMVEHPAYQQIIEMGMPIVPLILEKLAQKPDHWFEALYTITGVDPILPEHRGRLKAMAADWIKWGKEHGYNENEVRQTGNKENDKENQNP